MNLHEYQGKQLFAEYGLPVSTGYACDTVEEAVEAADKLAGIPGWSRLRYMLVDGARLVASSWPNPVMRFARLPNSGWVRIWSPIKPDENGQPVSKILVEECADIAKSFTWVLSLIVPDPSRCVYGLRRGRC